MDNSPVICDPQNDQIQALFTQTVSNVRDDFADNPYIAEALKVLPVGGYRSAIGSFWNAVVDDLRNKIMHRSLDLFNKAVAPKKDVKIYEDFQNCINDDELIEGAFKIGVIGWEAAKVLKHAKETRHIFDGHPKSSEPSIFKVLSMFGDCVKYVLSEPYPVQIVDIEDYIKTMDSAAFDRNEFAVENATAELPEIYKNQLINQLYTVYIHAATSTTLKSNIEFVAPILWPVLPKETRLQITRRVDQQITKGDKTQTDNAFSFINIVGANAYLSAGAKRYKLEPIIDTLANSLDAWDTENTCVKELFAYAANIPQDLQQKYVGALTQTYVGRMGSSIQFSRRDFYANAAAHYIPKMFEAFDDNAASAFIENIKSNSVLRRRIEHPTKLARLRSLGNVILERISNASQVKAILEALVDESRAEDFFKLLRQS